MTPADTPARAERSSRLRLSAIEQLSPPPSAAPRAHSRIRRPPQRHPGSDFPPAEAEPDRSGKHSRVAGRAAKASINCGQATRSSWFTTKALVQSLQPPHQRHRSPVGHASRDATRFRGRGRCDAYGDPRKPRAGHDRIFTVRLRRAPPASARRSSCGSPTTSSAGISISRSISSLATASTSIYEQKFRDGEYIGDGRILAADFINDGTSSRRVLRIRGRPRSPTTSRLTDAACAGSSCARRSISRASAPTSIRAGATRS